MQLADLFIHSHMLDQNAREAFFGRPVPEMVRDTLSRYTSIPSDGVGFPLVVHGGNMTHGGIISIDRSELDLVQHYGTIMCTRLMSGKEVFIVVCTEKQQPL